MEEHWTLADQNFVEAFKDCTLNPGWFTHEAHLRIGYLYINIFGVRLAAKKLCQGIAKFDNAHGDGTKFHRTITMASIAILQHFREKSNSCNFADLLNEYPVLKNNFKGLLLTHYSENLIYNEESRIFYKLPDRLPDRVFEKVNF
ncbi:MAG: hypothetical protein KDC53_23505 [Saprospiraceae bacterium]|nr:hypothetical protein [Saprospiraceae bacterium]